jgi:hypothetical protein
MTLNALCFFSVSVANRHTFEAQFGWDASSPKARAGAAAKSPTCCGAACGRTDPAIDPEQKEPRQSIKIAGASYLVAGIGFEPMTFRL